MRSQQHVIDADTGAGALAVLARTPGVLHVRFRAGDVMLYRDHVPIALYAVLAGEVHLTRSRQWRERRTRTAMARECHGPAILPPDGVVDAPSAVTLRALTDVEALAVPRSLVPGLRAVLLQFGSADPGRGARGRGLRDEVLVVHRPDS
jgi:hypothetical protein